jgi:hypothetical protein
VRVRSEETTSLPRINGHVKGQANGEANGHVNGHMNGQANGKDAAAAFELRPPSRLKSALLRARLDEAERSEVIAELRGAEIARLEMLKDEVAPLIAEIPQGVDVFDVGLVPGDHPRLFIDMIGFVEMGRDRRSYTFIQDTRHGRVILAESERLEPMVEAVTNYVARRLIEREKALAGDMTIEQAVLTYANAKKPDAGVREAKAKPAPMRFGAMALTLLTELIGSIVLVALVALGAREAFRIALAWWTGQ